MLKSVLKFFVGCALFFSCTLFGYNKLILQFDLNETLIAKDSITQKSLDDILETFEVTPAEKAAMKAKLKSRQGLVFPSFYRLLSYLQKEKIDYTIVLRTFGSDLPCVVPEINRYIKPAFFCLRGAYKNGFFYFEGLGQKNFQETYALTKQHQFIAIRDDYEEWAKYKKSRDHGKRFVVDKADKETLSLFFDDNIAEGPHSIVTPVDLAGKPLEHSYHLIIVDTAAAIKDDDYYINLVKRLLSLK